MRRHSAPLIISSLAAIVVVIFAISLSSILRADTTLEFYVRDAVSKKWVWDLTAQLQGHEIRSFYQSDEAPAVLRFVGLASGKATSRT